MASIELRTPKNKPAYYKITANITLNGRTIPASRSVSQRQEQLWEGVKEILTQLSKLS